MGSAIGRIDPPSSLDVLGVRLVRIGTKQLLRVLINSNCKKIPQKYLSIIIINVISRIYKIYCIYFLSNDNEKNLKEIYLL